MRTRILTLMLLVMMATATNAQSWISSYPNIYTNPDTAKVGIGISSPTERLHVYKGALKIGKGSSASDRSAALLKFGDGSYVQIGEWEADDMMSF